MHFTKYKTVNFFTIFFFCMWEYTSVYAWMVAIAIVTCNFLFLNKERILEMFTIYEK